MKRLFGLVLAGVLLLGVFCAPAAAGGDDVVRVWTQNLYLGADLTPLITATSAEEFLAAADEALTQIALNNFPLRARRLATEVALTQPDLIGLQEVFNFELNGTNAGPPFVDYLDTLLDALAARHQRYRVAAIVKHLDITIDIDVDGDGIEDSVHVLDRDVILVRNGVKVFKLDGDISEGGLCGAPIPNPAYPYFDGEFFSSTPSEDGCNYTILAEANSPVGTITIERGFVGVDARVRGKTYRFVNTHLEEVELIPDHPETAIYQSLQAAELIGTLLATTPLDTKLILVGDFNSSPVDMPINIEIAPGQIIQIVPPYQIIAGEDFEDIWDTNILAFLDPEGFTCCQEGDLANRRSLLDERIDLIFVYDSLFRPKAFVTGRVPIFPLSVPPNWSSDHGGVFARLFFKKVRGHDRPGKRWQAGSW